MKKNIVFLMVAFCAVLSANAVTTINIPKAGGLSQTLSQEQMDTCTMIVLTGELNSEDLRLLRRMTKLDAWNTLTYQRSVSNQTGSRIFPLMRKRPACAFTGLKTIRPGRKASLRHR